MSDFAQSNTDKHKNNGNIRKIEYLFYSTSQNINSKKTIVKQFLIQPVVNAVSFCIYRCA